MDKKVYNKIKLQYIKEKDIIIFQQLRNGIMGQTMNLPVREAARFRLRLIDCRRRLSDLIKRIKGNIRAICLQLHK